MARQLSHQHALAISLSALMATGALGLAAPPAFASGAGSLSPWYLDQYGGEQADLRAKYDGRLGIVMARSPKPHLFIAWRVLHGLKVGPEAGVALSIPCCDAPGDPYEPDAPPSGVYGWIAARKAVPGAAEINYVPAEREGANYTSITNCFPDAFDTAARTLQDRAARHGAGSADVRAWLNTQDAVFASCHDVGVSLPAANADAPAWLVADRAYQEAAFALYDGRHGEAAERFADIAKDKTSPWRASAPYLVVRAKVRAALAQKTPAAFAAARAAAKAFVRTPPDTFGRTQALGLGRVLDYREKPDALLAELDRQLAQREPLADIAVAFRDYANLGAAAQRAPDAIDWMATMAAEIDWDDVGKAAGDGGDYDAAEARLRSAARVAGQAHAARRWSQDGDAAWLIAALSLTNPDDASAPGLVRDADQLAPASPAWLTVHYHAIRLTLPKGDPAALRARLDAILARPDLNSSDRAIFRAQRLQVASDPAEFARLSLRKRICRDMDLKTDGCVRTEWLSDSIMPSGVYDLPDGKGTVGFGEDARAVIDRLALADRMALSRDATLPSALRLDVALTSYARAVQLQDNAAIDGLARDLTVLLPQLAGDWKTIAATPPGPDKRFAQFLVLAKIPGVRVDLVDYTRPEGTVAQFQYYWTPWFIPAAGKPPGGAAPDLAGYQAGGYGVGSKTPDAETDLTCLGECGRGVAPLRLPAFAQAGQAKATAERAYFFRADPPDAEGPSPIPATAVSAWDEMLAWAAANPKDPRVPEALYWLNRVGRFGGSHNHSGRRAFRLLHAAYPKSEWTKKSPYFYD